MRAIHFKELAPIKKTSNLKKHRQDAGDPQTKGTPPSWRCMNNRALSITLCFDHIMRAIHFKELAPIKKTSNLKKHRQDAGDL